MSFYSQLASDVVKTLAEFGQSVIVTNFELGQEDPTTGVVTQTSSQFTTVGVLFDYDYRNFGDGAMPYQAINTSDKRLLIVATKPISPGDLLFVDGILYKAHIIKVVNPGGVRIVYDIWMQR